MEKGVRVWRRAGGGEKGVWKSVLECGEGEGRCGEVGKVRVV